MAEPFEKLVLWQRAMRLVDALYAVTDTLPADEKTNLSATLRKTVLGLPGRVADAGSQADLVAAADALEGCRGDVRTLETGLAMARRLRYIRWSTRRRLQRQLDRFVRLLDRDIQRLRATSSGDQASTVGPAEDLPPMTSALRYEFRRSRSASAATR